jgi:hypothetical protein
MGISSKLAGICRENMSEAKAADYDSQALSGCPHSAVNDDLVSVAPSTHGRFMLGDLSVLIGRAA